MPEAYDRVADKYISRSNEVKKLFAPPPQPDKETPFADYYKDKQKKDEPQWEEIVGKLPVIGKPISMATSVYEAVKKGMEAEGAWTERLPWTPTGEESIPLEGGFKVTQDGSVWKEGIPLSVGKVDFETGEFDVAVWAKTVDWIGKAVEGAMIPFTMYGETARVLKKERERIKAVEEEQGVWAGLKASAEFPEKVGFKEWLPGGEIYKEFKELPILEQFRYEAPAWAISALLPGALGLKGALAPAIAKGGIKGAFAKAGAAVLTPPALAEKGMGVGLKYGVVIPLQKVGAGTSVALQKAFEKALDAGLDKWLVRQGIRGDQAPRVVQFFMKTNKNWLFDQAKANLLKKKGIRMNVEQRATMAAEETIRNAEPKLLEAIKSSGVKPEPVAPVKAIDKEIALTRGYGLDELGRVPGVAPDIKGVKSVIDTELAKYLTIRPTTESGAYTRGLNDIKAGLDRVEGIKLDVKGGKITPLTGSRMMSELISKLDNNLQDLRTTELFNEAIWDIWQRYNAIEMGIEKPSDTLEILARDVGMALGEEVIERTPYEKGGRRLREGLPPAEITPPTGAPVTPAPRKTAGKEPWQMSADEYMLLNRTRFAKTEAAQRSLNLPALTPAQRTQYMGELEVAQTEMISSRPETARYIEVERALNEGKPVPPSVLKDFPKLAQFGQAVMPGMGMRLEVAVFPTPLPRKIENVLKQVAKLENDILNKPAQYITTKQWNFYITTKAREISKSLERVVGDAQWETYGTPSEPVTKIINKSISDIKGVMAQPETAPSRLSEIARDMRTVMSGTKYLARGEAPVTEAFTPSSIEDLSNELMRVSAEAEGLRIYLASEPSRALINLIKTSGKMKGDLPNITIAQYKQLSGRESVPPTLLTQDRKHVRWEYALDDMATEMGYPDGEALREAILTSARDARRLSELTTLENRLAGEMAEMGEASPAIDQIKDLYASTQDQVGAFQASIKGLKGKEEALARTTLSSLERELTRVQNILGGIMEKPSLSDAMILRETITAWARHRGLAGVQLVGIYKEVGGYSSLSSMNESSLHDVLARVRVSRPQTIRFKTVITVPTEQNIVTLRSSLTKAGQMSDDEFTRIMGELQLTTTKYESQLHFATEQEGRSIIRAMLDDAPIIEERLRVTKAVVSEPNIAREIEGLDKRILASKKLLVEGKPVAGAFQFQDMRYYVMSLEKQTGAPYYKAWATLNTAHLEARQRMTLYAQKLVDVPGFKGLKGDEKALSKISDSIARKYGLIKGKPIELTPSEQALADAIDGELTEFINVARVNLFEDGYYQYGSDVQKIKNRLIPNAPTEDLRQAVNILEGKGRDKLIEFLNTKKWGVKGGHSDPYQVVDPLIYNKAPAPRVSVKGRIVSERGVRFRELDKNVLARLNTYIKSMTNQADLTPHIRHFQRVFDESQHLLKNPYRVASDLERAILELQGTPDPGGAFATTISRIYSQTMAAVFFDPAKWLRNLHQNAAFSPDRLRLVLPSTFKPFTEQELLYFNTYVSQKIGLAQDYLMREYEALPGFKWATKQANRISLYPWTDETNRKISFKMRKARVDGALEKYATDKDLKRFSEASGLYDLELIQQKEALELLAQETIQYNVPGLEAVTGTEAYGRYLATQVTNNVQFMYERAQRSPAEMGSVGRIVGNLFAFPRSYTQRIGLQGRKIFAKNTPWREKEYAFRQVFGMIVISMLVGEVYMVETGRTYNPYAPANIVGWVPGGLSIGAAQELFGAVGTIARAMTGDEQSYNTLMSTIPRLARLEVPFYKFVIESLEATTQTDHLDKKMIRELRRLIDNEYKIRPELYEADRKWFEAIQHAFFSGDPREPEDKEAAVTFTNNAVAKLGKIDLERQEDDYRKAETPNDIVRVNEKNYTFTMSNLGSAFADATRNIDKKDITVKNGFDPLVVEWANAQLLIDKYYDQLADDRESYRARNPEVDAALVLWKGYSSIKSVKAKTIVNDAIRKYKIPPEAISQPTIPTGGRSFSIGAVSPRGGRTTGLGYAGGGGGRAFGIGAAWGDARRNLNSVSLGALNKVWYGGGALSPSEETTLKKVWQSNQMGEPVFNTWLKNTLRQSYESSLR